MNDSLFRPGPNNHPRIVEEDGKSYWLYGNFPVSTEVVEGSPKEVVQRVYNSRNFYTELVKRGIGRIAYTAYDEDGQLQEGYASFFENEDMQGVVDAGMSFLGNPEIEGFDRPGPETTINKLAKMDLMSETEVQMLVDGVLYNAQVERNYDLGNQQFSVAG